MKDYSTVTYHFEDGTKQVCQINSKILVDEKGRKRSESQILNVFETTAWDLGATSYVI